MRISRVLRTAAPGLLLPLLVVSSAVAAKPVLAPVPVGSTLPVLLERGLDSKHVRVGQPVVARLAQRVPLGEGRYLPSDAELVGSVIALGPATLSLLFTGVRLRGASEPVRVKLIAAASWLDVISTRDSLGGATHDSSDITTKQVGGDEIYGANVATKVYDQYSQPVGRADGTGVYAPSLAPDEPERSMGPFSTTAAGLYDIDGLGISSVGAGGPIVFALKDPRWQLHTGSGLLMQVVEP